MINVREIKALDDKVSGYYVFFPYALKDSFKATFKTAKWDAARRAWCVGPRSKKHLDQWIAAVSGAVETAEKADKAHDEMPLTEEEIRDLEKAARELIVENEKLKAEIEEHEQLKSKVAALREKLTALRAEKEALTAARDAKRAENEKAMSGVIDVAEIDKAINEMKAARRAGIGSRNRIRFDSAQEVLNKARSALEKVGMKSRGLDFLVCMNFNRPDRDRFCDAPDLFDIETL